MTNKDIRKALDAKLKATRDEITVNETEITKTRQRIAELEDIEPRTPEEEEELLKLRVDFVILIARRVQLNADVGAINKIKAEVKKRNYTSLKVPKVKILFQVKGGQIQTPPAKPRTIKITSLSVTPPANVK